MNQPTQTYPLILTTVLPFRAAIPAAKFGVRLPDEDWDTTLIIAPQDELAFGENTAPLSTTHRSVSQLETRKKFVGSHEQFVEWARQRSPVDRCGDWLMQRLNLVLLSLKRACESNHGIPIRPVGYLDLVFYSIVADGEPVLARSNPYRLPPQQAIEQVPTRVTNEWRLLARAVDLVNHGFEIEGLIVAFAQLDDVTQVFLKHQMTRASEEDRTELLRMIERKRLKTYLGPLLRALTGTSPLDSRAMLEDLEWLNRKRNDAMHNGESCTNADARRGLEIVHRFLIYFRDAGMGLDLPERLYFW